MRLAIHQPYLFPYLGYFQLIYAVDTFFFFDDVAFRKQGWINRNRLLIKGVPRYFSVPLRGASSSTPINQTSIDRRQFPEWRRKLVRSLVEIYAGSPQRDAVLDLVETALATDAPDIGTLAGQSVRLCCEYLGIKTRLLASSQSFPRSAATGLSRVLEICRGVGATTYVNAPDGRQLYEREAFSQAGIVLRFLKPELEPYPQPGTSFVPGLSILDLLMRLDPSAARVEARRGILE
jgi:hypothetical protein